MARGGSLLAGSWSIAIDPARRDGRIVAESSEPGRRARPVSIPASLDPGFAEALGRAGIESLYTHQLAALETAARSNLVVTSGTASGKSLAFNLPVLDSIARDGKQRALYLYPTKALAQDQARKLAQLRPPGLREAIYDGDTPREERPAIRRRRSSRRDRHPPADARTRGTGAETRAGGPGHGTRAGCEGAGSRCRSDPRTPGTVADRRPRRRRRAGSRGTASR